MTVGAFGVAPRFVQMIFILYTVLNGTYFSFGQGTTSSLPYYPKRLFQEKRFNAVLGEVHLHCWNFIVVRHGGHVHRDVFCFLFLRLALTHSFSILSFSSRASIAMGPFEGVSLMVTHSSK